MQYKLLYQGATGAIIAKTTATDDMFGHDPAFASLDITTHSQLKDIWNSPQNYKVVNGKVLAKTSQEIAQNPVRPVPRPHPLLDRLAGIEARLTSLEKKTK